MFSLTSEIFYVNFIHVTMPTADLLLTVPLASVSVKYCTIQRNCQSPCLRGIYFFTLLFNYYSFIYGVKLFNVAFCTKSLRQNWMINKKNYLLPNLMTVWNLQLLFIKYNENRQLYLGRLILKSFPHKKNSL